MKGMPYDINNTMIQMSFQVDEESALSLMNAGSAQLKEEALRRGILITIILILILISIYLP